MLKRIIKIIGSLVGIVVLVFIVYLAYLMISYKRIPDYQVLEPVNSDSGRMIRTGETLTAVTQNCGFGAYTSDFTFFMDGGKQSWAASKESAAACIDAAADKALSFQPDFVLFQEVDTDATRTYHLNEVEQLINRFEGYSSVYAANYHSAFLFYPFYQPHGASNSGILTLSRAGIGSAMRRSLEVSSGFNKIVDLDRCYSVSRIPVEGGKELVLYNVHLSAYGNSDAIRTSQMTQLLNDMKGEYEAGNYCVCGGDFNHDFTGDSTQVFNGGAEVSHGWAMPFPEELLPDGIVRCLDYDDEEPVATCRNCDVPYGPDCMTFIVDGFLVSGNVRVEELHNIDTGFSYSDHCPVVMSFVLLNGRD